MIKIEKNGNSVIITQGDVKQAFPLNTLIAHYSNDSDTIELRYKGSRKNVLSALYTEFNQGSTKEKTLANINNLIN